MLKHLVVVLLIGFVLPDEGNAQVVVLGGFPPRAQLPADSWTANDPWNNDGVQYPKVEDLGGGDQDVVWYDSVDSDIKEYSFGPNTSDTSATVCLGRCRRPDVNGGIFTYELHAGAADGDIYEHVIGGIEQVRAGGAGNNDRYPTIYNGNIAYERLATNNVLVFDQGGGGTTTTLTACPLGGCVNASRPEIWTSYVVFESNVSDIFYTPNYLAGFPGPTFVRVIPAPDNNENFPHINVGRVVYEGDGVVGAGRTPFYFDLPWVAAGETEIVDPPDSICAGYMRRPRVGGVSGELIIFRALSCDHDGDGGTPALSDALYLHYTGGLAPVTYFIDQLPSGAGNHPDSEPTQYDIDGEIVVYRDVNGELQLVDIDMGAL